MSHVENLIRRQKDAFESECWQEGDLLPYRQRRDGTFGQYVANADLIALEPFVATLAKQTVITVCDGRGVEGGFMKTFGLEATATDLSVNHLKKVWQRGDVHHFSQENAESLSFEDGSFDWGFVKSGLHHLPRPMLGIYELLRVARNGIILMEGYDGFIISKIREIWLSERDWESSGNYVYRFTRREIAKVCLALGLPMYAVKTCFLPWHRSQERYKKGTLGYRLQKMAYGWINMLFSRHGNKFSALLFKTPASETQIQLLRRSGFQVISLPSNPHIEHHHHVT